MAVSRPDDRALRQVMLDRLRRQQQVVEAARGMLEGQARDFKHLMGRINLRFTIARAEANIERIKGKLRD